MVKNGCFWGSRKRGSKWVFFWPVFDLIEKSRFFTSTHHQHIKKWGFKKWLKKNVILKKIENFLKKLFKICRKLPEIIA
jgi:hypothetical protein